MPLTPHALVANTLSILCSQYIQDTVSTNQDLSIHSFITDFQGEVYI